MRQHISHGASNILRHKGMMDQYVSLYLQENPEITYESFNEMVVNDKLTIELIKTGRTESIPALSLIGYEPFMHKLSPSCLNEVMASVVMFRSCPIGYGLLDSYIDSKKGYKDVKYLLPALVPILNKTYGEILYFDQFYQVMNELVGFTTVESNDFLEQDAPLDKRTNYGKAFFKLTQARGLSDMEVKSFLKTVDEATLFDKKSAEEVAMIIFQGAYFMAHVPSDFIKLFKPFDT